MHHSLIDSSGQILRGQDFDGPAPDLATEKGLRWVPDVPPAYDPATQTCTPILPVTGDAVTYTVQPIPAATLAERNNANVLAQITNIEARQARAVREAALGDPTYLRQIDYQIQALRAQLVPV